MKAYETPTPPTPSGKAPSKPQLSIVKDFSSYTWDERILDYTYYEHDGDYFRRPLRAAGVTIKEVLDPVAGTWNPYTTNQVDPVWVFRSVTEIEINDVIARERRSQFISVK